MENLQKQKLEIVISTARAKHSYFVMLNAEQAKQMEELKLNIYQNLMDAPIEGIEMLLITLDGKLVMYHAVPVLDVLDDVDKALEDLFGLTPIEDDDAGAQIIPLS